MHGVKTVSSIFCLLMKFYSTVLTNSSFIWNRSWNFESVFWFSYDSRTVLNIFRQCFYQKPFSYTFHHFSSHLQIPHSSACTHCTSNAPAIALYSSLPSFTLSSHPLSTGYWFQCFFLPFFPAFLFLPSLAVLPSGLLSSHLSITGNNLTPSLPHFAVL